MLKNLKKLFCPILMAGIMVTTTSSFSGCILAGIGLAAAVLSEDEERQYAQTNVERGEAGQAPLTRAEWKRQYGAATERHRQ